MREFRCGGAHGSEHLDLDRRVRNMIFAAQHMGDAHVDIVNCAWKHIQPAAVGAADYRVGQKFGIKFGSATNTVIPCKCFVVVKFESPMRRNAFGFLGRALLFFELQCTAIVDWRQPAPQLHLALQLQLLCSLVCGIHAARLFQLLKCGVIAIQPLRLAFLAVRLDPEPRQISADCIDIFLFATRSVGIIDPQYELTAALLGEHPIMQRGADIADMQAAGRRRCETGSGHARPYRRPALG